MAKSNDKNVFDVSKPGKSAPSATSRPIITGHGPMLKDPMVSDKQTEEKPVDESPVAKTTDKVIEPVGDIKIEDTEVKSDDTEDKIPVKVVEPKVEESKDKPDEVSVVPTIEQTDTISDAEDSNDVPSSVNNEIQQSLNSQNTGPTKEELERQQQIEGLIEAETYFLPIGQVTRRKNNRRAAISLLLIMILIIAGGYLAIDAGLIESNLELPFDFINN